MTDFDTSTPTRIHPINPRVQALCLSGGGYRGLYTARILEKLQAFTKQPLHTHFDFIAGTSIGAIITAALAVGVPPTRIREEIEAIGPALFTKRKFHKARHLLFGAPYRQDLLVSTLTKLFTEVGAHDELSREVESSSLKLIVTATNASTHEPRIYGGNKLPFERTPGITLLQAILASSAAPTYFPAQIHQGEMLVDGGLSANAPDVIALSLLQRRRGAKLTDCYLLSIGTCAPARVATPARRANAGKLGWIRGDRNIVDLTLDSQERLTINLMHQMLKAQFFRIDSTPTGKDAEAVSTLDHAAPETTAALKRLADERFDLLSKEPTLKAFFR